MGFLTDHPHTAITDTIDRVCSSQQYTLEVELASILQQIGAGKNEHANAVNQLEAARCLRKKLKYGNKLQQLRALDLLNLFVSQRVMYPQMYNDVKLLDRLQVIALQVGPDGKGIHYDSKVIKKCIAYTVGWYGFLEEQGPTHGYEGLYELGRKVNSKYSHGRSGATPRIKKRKGFMNDKADPSVMTADERYGIPQIDMEKEGPKIRLLISDSLATSVSLKNTLMALPSSVKSTDSEEATAKFIQARAMRRKVLRYLQLVTEGDSLGSLIHANEQLVAALTAYDDLSGEVSEYEISSSESDEDETGEEGALSKDASPSPGPQVKSASNDPFADQNHI